MAIRLKDRVEANIRQSDKVNSSLSIQLNSGTATVYNGSAVKTINITPAAIGAPSTDGTGATGTWGINISGNANTANTLAVARTFQIADNDGTNKGPTVSFNGTTNVIINLPSIIKSNINGTASGNLPHFFVTNGTEIAKIPKEATSGWYHMNFGDATILPTANHGSVLIENDCGTPYQLFFPDNQLDVYKRFGISSWGTWQRLNAGYAETASRLATARTISLTGDVTGSASFDGSNNISITATVADNSHNHSNYMTDSQTVPNACDFNTVIKSGVYRYNDQSTYTNSPPNSWGQILVLHGAGDTIAQLAFDYNGPNAWLRQGNPTDCGGAGSWHAWKRIWIEDNSVTGAVWNDYAEYRESDCKEYGRVLIENGNDTLSISIERLQPFAGISSDTWGFCQGETEKAKTPIAVAGRVLAYPYQNRNNYKPGDCVCAAPNGTVDIMTRQEVIQYPDRIVGTVSCIPDYEEWGQGDRPAVKVDGRIWIKVR